MEKRDIILKLEDMVVLDACLSLQYILRMLPPNGAYVHRQNNYLCNLDGWVHRYSNGESRHSKETFAQFRQRDPERYERRVEKIYDMLQEFDIKF